ncbi:hypothetical protein PUMCH_001118 [Australozyma saopauloensis]|uniref:Deacetylase sirtuin-type domain-containing protein n=1 Tax=Australozyma saopauloensis TaxID=291208 RepID=A0AAX4H5Y9_9ASCO|nr:hypothetical protein PUMCH_001118 [[Candida] saopauloensis]
MGSNQSNNVILLDSDLDSELQHVSKKQKVAMSVQPTQFQKPLMQESESDSDTSVLSQNDSYDEIPLAERDRAVELLLTNGSKRGNGDSLSNVSADSSDLEEYLPEEDKGAESDATVPGPKKRTIFESRRFLKTRGPMEFLQEYLPPTASSEDILDLITKLGFLPRNLPPLLDGENLLQLIKLLHLAMKRVRQLRSRLDDFCTEDDVLKKLQSAKKILVITGAGISTSLGIPDFRSSRGFYSRLSNLGLSDPQEVFDLDIFRSDPSIFYSIAHMILPPDNVYAPLHKFIRLLQDKGKLLRNYTQNIDNLEANAGIDPEKMIQCHGSFAFATCVTCGYKVKGSTLYPQIRAKEIPFCPLCVEQRNKLLDQDAYVEESYGVMKPDITFFGEALPLLFHDNINQDLRDCDLIISIGTSLKVAPVADIVDKVRGSVPQILINKDPIHHCNFDVSMLGYCDDVVSYLCDKLGGSWNIDHPSYESLVGEDHKNLSIELTREKGVYNIRNHKRELEAVTKVPEKMPEPDLVVLEPTYF